MKKLLLCTDGSHYTRVCYEYAAWLAERTQASIQLLHVEEFIQLQTSLIADFSGSLGVQPYQDFFTQLQTIENEKSRSIEEASLKFFQDKGLGKRVQFTQIKGTLPDAVEDIEEKDPDIDLVILGKRGENVHFAREHLGSSLERVVRASIKPCLVVPQKFTDIRKVLLACDGSPIMDKAIHFLCNSDMVKGLELHLITVDNHHQQDKAASILHQAEEKLKNSGYTLKCQMLIGEVEEQIAKYVNKENMDLLIMGAYGHSRIRNLLIGSITTLLIQSCSIPLLLFR
jgi:nucleotide-binding universal stress UspA family protein